MRVAAIEVRHLRILDYVNVEFSPQVNVLVGSNGSGKSSLLEAIHIIGSGRSFRSPRLRDVVAQGKSWLHIVGRTVGNDGTSESIGIEHSPDGLRIRRGGTDVRTASELAASLPIVAVTPDSSLLGHRRRRNEAPNHRSSVVSRGTNVPRSLSAVPACTASAQCSDPRWCSRRRAWRMGMPSWSLPESN